jgi:tetratricopeptide (TPR) repeat protein
MFLPVVFALAQPAAGVWSNGRPPECGTETSGVATANVWDRAKAPDLRRYCDLLASAASKLSGTAGMAQAALTAARQANDVLPGHAAPRVLEGRALAALGDLDEALAALRDGKALDPGALDDPLALLAWARVLGRTGHTTEAAEAYRALLPRTASLSNSERASAAVEAGLAAMASGPAGLDDAVAAFREALHEAQDEALSVAVLALALALDRRGDLGEARVLLADRSRGDPRSVLETARSKELLAVAPAEAAAIAAIALEPLEAAGARDAWEQYLTSLQAAPLQAGARKVDPSGHPVQGWEAHARAHLAALRNVRSAAPRSPR